MEILFDIFYFEKNLQAHSITPSVTADTSTMATCLVSICMLIAPIITLSTGYGIEDVYNDGEPELDEVPPTGN